MSWRDKFRNFIVTLLVGMIAAPIPAFLYFWIVLVVFDLVPFLPEIQILDMSSSVFWIVLGGAAAGSTVGFMYKNQRDECQLAYEELLQQYGEQYGKTTGIRAGRRTEEEC